MTVANELGDGLLMNCVLCFVQHEARGLAWLPERAKLANTSTGLAEEDWRSHPRGILTTLMRNGGMESATANPDFKPRRGKARLRAGIPAVLVTMDGRQVVSLVDLSETGAGLVVKDGWRINGGVLKWMDYEVYGTVVRRGEQDIGLRFEEPIDPNWVLETRAWLPELRRASDPFRRSAKRTASVGAGEVEKARVPGMVSLKYGSGGAPESALTVRTAAPFFLAALLLGAIMGYGSSLF